MKRGKVVYCIYIGIAESEWVNPNGTKPPWTDRKPLKFIGAS